MNLILFAELKNTNFKYDVLIIGAGAAGLMCAIKASKRGKKVAILEKESKVGKKILISGGGRCNFTNLNISAENYLSHNPHFCKSALSQYTAWDFIELMQKHSLSWTEKKAEQLFCDQKSGAILAMLLDECQTVDIFLNCEINQIKYGFLIKTNLGNFTAHSLVVATGGASIPKMGASDFGLKIAHQFGLKIINFTAGLVPFILKNHCFTGLSGISFKALIKCGKISFQDDILITHQGLSGPAILQISSYWRPGNAIFIDFFPDFNLIDYLLNEQKQQPKILLKSLLKQHISKKLANNLIKKSINLVDKQLAHIKQSELKIFAQSLKNFKIIPDSTQGFRTAEVCLGGVATDELSSKTLMTKSVENLYFIGETVDVAGHLGGYNLQWAWSSGAVAGQSAG